ncbi:hypothetical protein ONS96_008667 [Cadophora gregata f. sp. sojae]|nr:hypothetical protein ONS96_008667 [Cadophora gregata f. sp. sojae]
MPAPHDQRFSIIFKVAQQNESFTDQELLALFESALERVMKEEPELSEDEAITKALRAWFYRVMPEKDMPEFLAEGFRQKRLPRLGDAVVIPSQAKGTFWWNRETKKVQWVWWDPDPSKAGQVLHTEPQATTSQLPEEQTQISRTGQRSPSDAVKTESMNHEDTMGAAGFSGIHQARLDRSRLGSSPPDSGERNQEFQT